MAKTIFSNIRKLFCEYEMKQESAEADGDIEEARHWENYMDILLTKMTSEQRSLILDEEYFCDAPEAYEKTLSIVKKQEIDGIKYEREKK